MIEKKNTKLDEDLKLLLKLNKTMNKAIKHSSWLIKKLKSKIPQTMKESVNLRISLAARIDDVLQSRGLTNQEFAFKMGKKPSEISRWLSGTNNFTTDMLWEIERVLNIQLLVSSPRPEKNLCNLKGVDLKHFNERSTKCF